MSHNFFQLYEHSSGNAKVELDLSNCVTQANLKGATGIDSSMLTSKVK